MYNCCRILQFIQEVVSALLYPKAAIWLAGTKEEKMIKYYDDSKRIRDTKAVFKEGNMKETLYLQQMRTKS